MNLDHVGLTVGDLDAMTRWYTRILGLRVEFEFSLPEADFRGVMLLGGNHRIELHRTRGEK